MKNPSQWTFAVTSVVLALAAVALGGTVGGYLVLGWSAIATGLIFETRRRLDGDVRRLVDALTALSCLMIVGLVVRGIHGAAIGVESPIPSPADFFHIPAYLFFLGTSIFVHVRRSPRPNLDAWLDAAIFVLALSLLLWVGFFQDYLLGDAVPATTKLVNSIYNVIILITFAVFCRITATPGRRPPVYYLLGTAGFAYFGVDLAATYTLVRQDGLWMSIALSPIVYGFIVQAVRHPEADQLLVTDHEAEVTVGAGRLATIGLAISSPLVVVVAGRNHPTISVVVMTVICVAMAALVTVRVTLLLRSQRDAALRDRRLTEKLAVLSAIESTEKLIQLIPRTLEDVLDSSCQVSYSSQSSGPGVVALPELFRDHGRQSLQLSGRRSAVSPATLRVAESLLRGASLTAHAISGRSAKARQEALEEGNEMLAASERRFRALVENSSDIFAVLSPNGTVLSISETVSVILGYDANTFVGHTLTQVVHEQDAPAFYQGVVTSLAAGPERPETVELRFRTNEEQVRLLRCLFTNLLDVPEVEGIVLNATDVTDARTLERELDDVQHTDRLTRLPNRLGFLRRLELAVRHNDVADLSLAVARIGLRGFDQIKGALPTAVADEFMRQFATTVARSSRSEDVIARFGDDDLAILIDRPRDAAEAIATLERITQALAESVVVGAHEVQVRPDIGLVFRSGRDADASGLMRDAEIALTASRSKSSAGIVLFDPTMATMVAERLELQGSLPRGIRDGEFRLVYQPVVDMHTGKVSSFEALSRWMHPKLGPVSPGSFIEVAEQSGQIELIGEWSLRSACRQIQTWKDEGLSGFSVGVNMSVHQLRSPDILYRVLEITDGEGVDPSLLTIEVTESVLIDNSDLVSNRMRSLRNAGFRLAIDDFGTGYSSLGYLQQYEFDVLKIDKVFVDPLVDPHNEREIEVVRSIISLAQGLGAKTVAEGIEEETQYQLLAELGCDYGQGYLMARPLEIADVPDSLTRSLTPKLPTRA